MNGIQLFDESVHGLCCCGIMKLETAAFLVLYMDLACLIGQLAYVAASTMIQCCTMYHLLWLLLCAIQAILCIILFRAINNRRSHLLKLYIYVGIVGRTVLLIVWLAENLIKAFATKETPLQDSQLILIGFLIFCLLIISVSGILLIRCYLFFRRLHEKTSKCRHYRQMKLCPHKDHLHRENSGLLSHSTSNKHTFLLHELDLGKLI